MTTIPNKTLPGGCWTGRATAEVPAGNQNSAQSLRPTFQGWGPRL